MTGAWTHGPNTDSQMPIETDTAIDRLGWHGEREIKPSQKR